jgi:hypothetical protein
MTANPSPAALFERVLEKILKELGCVWQEYLVGSLCRRITRHEKPSSPVQFKKILSVKKWWEKPISCIEILKS